MSSNLPVVRDELGLKNQNVIYRDVTLGMVFGLMIGTFIGHFLIPRGQKVLREDEANTTAPLKLEENTSPEPSPLVVQEDSEVQTVPEPIATQTEDEDAGSQVLPDVSAENNRVVDVSKYNNK